MSQLLLDKDNADEDDDELAFRPFEVEAKRDPDYKLSVERAYADQRFQATMAHIFEKYGRDFEGIGDEIDLVTGEIVVNNGHVRNMRDEGDVGDGLRGDLTDGEDDEDEGILLEDLHDDEEKYQDETGEKANPVDFAKEGAHSGNGADDDDDEDRIIQGRQAARDSHSTALVLGSSSRNALIARTSLFGVQNASPLHSEPPTELPFASSPFSFDRSPFASEPWGFSGQYSDPLWDRPDLFAVQRPPSEQLPLKPSRYHFPARSGKSSIWAPGSRFRADDEEPLQSAFAATFGKHLLPRRKKILKHPLLLPSTTKLNEQGDDGRAEAEEDEGDEDVILTGKRSGENPIEASERTGDLRPSNNSAGKEAEERGGEGTSSDSGYRSAQSTRRSKKRKQRADEGPTRDENPVQSPGKSKKPSNREPKKLALKAKESAPTTTALELAEEGNGCRRSGRMRKQVEYLNKIPWAQALAEQKAERQATLLPAPDSQTSDDDAHVEEESSTGRDSEDEDQSALTGSEHECIPDSAAEDDDEEEEEQGEEEEEEVEGEGEAEDVVKAEKKLDEGGEAEEEEEEERQVPPALKDLPTSHGARIRDPDIAEHRHMQAPAGLPFKTTNSGYLLSDDEAPTSLSKPRKPTPKKRHEDVLPLREIRNVKAQTHIEPSSSDVSKEERPNQSSKKRRHKADAPIDLSPTASQSSIGHLDISTEDLNGVAPLSSSPTRFLSRITLNVSLDDTPQPPDAAPDKARHQLEAVPSSSPRARVNEDILKPTASRRNRRQSKKPVSPVVEQLSAEIAQSKQPTKATALPIVIEDSSYETCDDSSRIEPSSPVKASLHDEPAPPSPNKRTVSPPEAVARPSSQSPTKRAPRSPFKSPTKSPLKRAFAAEVDEPLPSLSKPPQTPRRPKRRLKVPSSRHSILSLLSDDEEEEDEEIDELGRNLAAMPKLQSSVAQTTARKVWRSSSRTREVYHTPVKKRPSEPVSPGSLVKTPGGTLRACGVDGYRCGRDFCFTCL
ncbi:hypothetical protein MKX07_002108 [Trichoderma sp. CBMAI-0711]|nr:hypothetical protein MKX07_002108 [Trichoderma sp. CBMAI-0711]